MKTSHDQSLWTKALIRSLIDAGIKDIVISPGYRSTPLVAALCEEPDPSFRLHSVFDERVAGFVALGQARLTGSPSLLICTSGTAGAHYYPAVIEANYARVPLIVLTADRPLAMDQCDSPQTIDQTQLFGSHVRGFFDLGDPRNEELALRAVCRKAVQAVELSLFAEPGPVHINFRAQKPLEPSPVEISQLPRVPQVGRSQIQAPVEQIRELAKTCQNSERGLLIAGPLPLMSLEDRNSILSFAKKSGLVVHAEASSQLRFLNADSSASDAVRLESFDVFLRDAKLRHNYKPDVIVQLGATPVSKGCELLLKENQDVPHYLISPFGWPERHSRNITLIRSDVTSCLRNAEELLTKATASTPWLEDNREFDRKAKLKVNASLEDSSLNEGQITRALLAAIPEAGILFGANGLPIRHLDTFGPIDTADIQIISQRGTSGIDGQIAGAIGVASAGDSPSALLVGDIGFLHDASALSNAKLVKNSLVVVIINNGGGRIFEQLPAAKASPTRENFSLWTTPHSFDFEKICQAYEIPCFTAHNIDELNQELSHSFAKTGLSVINAIVKPDSFQHQSKRIWGDS